MSVQMFVDPVIRVQLYRSDVVVVRKGDPPDMHDTARGDIKCFSRKSRARLAFVAANTHVTFRTIITLTYPSDFPTDGKRVKRHWFAFRAFVSRELDGPEYLWFLEFQKRGAPHIHLLLSTSLPAALRERQALRAQIAGAWYRIVGSDDERHLRAGTSVAGIRKVNGAVHYAVKYAMKMRQKRVPVGYQDVGRFWGCSRMVTPSSPVEVGCTEDDVRGVLESWGDVPAWPHAPADDELLHRVLYNVSERFTDFLGLPSVRPPIA